MLRRLKDFHDGKLRRKIALLRGLFLLVEVAAVVLVLNVALGCELLARASLSGSRADSRATVGTIYCSDSPLIYGALTLWHIAGVTLFVFGFYAVLATLIEKFHGRPMLRRKYPY